MLYRIKSKSLSFNGKNYTAVSGPFGDGKLPTGDYEIRVREAVEGATLSSPYCAGGVCFFIPIIPLFNAKGRTGFGIHPDGNVAGTKGCIGISSSDAKDFLNEWKKLGLGNRPTIITVLD
jgi:hypothetical protein